MMIDMMHIYDNIIIIIFIMIEEKIYSIYDNIIIIISIMTKEKVYDGLFFHQKFFINFKMFFFPTLMLFFPGTKKSVFLAEISPKNQLSASIKEILATNNRLRKKSVENWKIAEILGRLYLTSACAGISEKISVKYQ